MAKGEGNYQISFYCECGTTLHYSGLDPQEKAAVEQLIEKHTQQGHQTVSPREARDIRSGARRSPQWRRTARARARSLRAARPIIQGQRVRRARRLRPGGHKGWVAPGPWHAIAAPSLPGGTPRTLCGYSIPPGSTEVQEEPWEPQGQDSCQRCQAAWSRRP